MATKNKPCDTENEMKQCYLQLDHLREKLTVLAELAKLIYGPEDEKQIRIVCYESQLRDVEDKLRALKKEYDMSRNLETQVVANYGEYLAAMNKGKQGNESVSEAGSNLVDGSADSVPEIENGYTPSPSEKQSPEISDRFVKLLTAQELNDVHSYMKKRSTLLQINAIIEKMNEILENKDRILGAGQKGAKSREDKENFFKFRAELHDTDGGRCCTEEELRQVIPARDVVHLQPMIQILRHYKRIGTRRVGKMYFLIVIPH